MEFTETQSEILFHAWALAVKDHGVAVVEEAEPEAEELAEAGWLERRTVDESGDRAYFWTPQAETALDVSALTESVKGREN